MSERKQISARAHTPTANVTETSKPNLIEMNKRRKRIRRKKSRRKYIAVVRTCTWFVGAYIRLHTQCTVDCFICEACNNERRQQLSYSTLRGVRIAFAFVNKTVLFQLRCFRGRFSSSFGILPSQF